MQEDVRIILTDEGRRADLRGAYVVEASPSPGAAGAIALNYLIENLKPLKLGEIRSAHFPHISIVDDGLASPPKIDLYFYRDKDVKLVIVSRNFPVDSSEGSYVVAKKVHEFLVSRGAVNYCLLSSSRITGEPAVYVASHDPEDARIFLNSGARLSPNIEMLPLDKLASFMFLLYSRNGGAACLLISETVSYFPDPVAAKRLLQVISKALKIEVSLEKLDQEIEKHKMLLEDLQRGYGKLIPTREEKPSREPFYIG